LVREVVARTFQLPLDAVSAETGYGNPEAWDSLGHLMLMMELETALQVHFSTEQISRPRTVAELCALVAELSPDD
jgi:acyl carrier protein